MERRREGGGKVAKHGVAPDNFSLWHKCRRWTERGLSCPFGRIEEREESEPEGDLEGQTSGAEALQRAIGDKLGLSGFKDAFELLGPLLALFTVLRGVQTLGKSGLQMGRVQAAGVSEEATVRVLRPHKPQVPAREGPSPARPGPARVPVRSGGGGFFSNQAAELKMMLGRR